MNIETPTTASIVYAGQNVAFVFTLDIRDQAIDLIVTRSRSEENPSSNQRVYSSSLFQYLVDYCGFRGGAGAGRSSASSKADQAFLAIENLLAHPCLVNLLADRPDSLP
jgi:hypothetical protein